MVLGVPILKHFRVIHVLNCGLFSVFCIYLYTDTMVAFSILVLLRGIMIGLVLALERGLISIYLGNM